MHPSLKHPVNKSSIRLESLLSPTMEQWLGLFNDKRVRKHMPLASESVDANWVEKWIKHKLEESENSPFKVKSIWVNENFAGWAAIQKDGTDYELAIVMNPSHWGAGIYVFQRLIQEFHDSKILGNLFVYLPFSRNSKNIGKKFPVREAGSIEINGIEFSKLQIDVGGEGFEPPTSSV